MIQKTIILSVFVLGIGLYVHSNLQEISSHSHEEFSTRKVENSHFEKLQNTIANLMGQETPVAPVTSTPTKIALTPEAAKAHWKNIQHLHRCWENLNCGTQFPDSYASERSFFIRDLLLKEIDELLTKSFHGETQESQASRAVELLIQLPDDMIRGKALDLASQLPANPKLVDLINEEIVPELIDVELTEKVANEFARQLKAKTGQDEKILSSIEEIILRGGVFASKEMARRAPQLLSERELPLVNSWIAQLPEGSERRVLLSKR
jgi:hypothetical protein